MEKRTIDMAMCYVKPQFIEEATEPMTFRRRHSYPMILVASLAVLCAMSIMAVAGAVLGNSQWMFFAEQGDTDTQFMAKATYGGTEIPEQRIEELKAAIEQGRETIFHSAAGVEYPALVHETVRTFESLEELEASLDIDLLYVPLNGKTECYYISTYDEEQDALYIDVYYRAQNQQERAEAGSLIQLIAYICTKESVPHYIRYDHSNEEQKLHEYRIEMLNVNAYLAESKSYGGQTICYFTADGIAYEMSVVGSIRDAESALETLQY